MPTASQLVTNVSFPFSHIDCERPSERPPQSMKMDLEIVTHGDKRSQKHHRPRHKDLEITDRKIFICRDMEPVA